MDQWRQFLSDQGMQLNDSGAIEAVPDISGAQFDIFVTNLSAYGTLAIAGPDSKKFLQGQVTCNLEQASNTQTLHGAYCTPKGSVIANFDLIDQSSAEDGDALLLHMAADVVPNVVSAMSKYIVFSQATLQDVTSNWVRLGLWGDGAHALLHSMSGITNEQGATAPFLRPETAMVYCQHSDCFVVYCAPQDASLFWQAINAHAQPKPLLEWDAHMIASGYVYVSAPLSEDYVPQMLNLQETGAIDFQKGCYTGQEVVARMQYLGKLKRHLHIGTITNNSNLLPQVGMALCTAARKSVGKIAAIGRSQDGTYQFAGIISIKDAADPTLGVQEIPGSNIEVLPLPYSIDPQVFERIKL